MGNAVYQWKSQMAFASVDPQAVGERLERIRLDKSGELTPEFVLEDAREAKSPLHGCFEWDDGLAAERYRLTQAGDVIRSITVVVSAPNPETPSTRTRAFVNVETEAGRHYTSIAHAMSDADLRKQVLHRAFQELQSWRSRYTEYQELAAVFGAIDEVEKKIAG